MQTMPAMLMEPGRHLPPGGKAGGRSEPTEADTSFQQQLSGAGASQDHDNSYPLADYGEQVEEGLLAQNTGEMVNLQPWTLPSQSLPPSVHGDEDIIHTVTGQQEQNITTVSPDELPPDTVAVITAQPSLSGKQALTLADNINHATRIINSQTGEQNQTQIPAGAVIGKQENAPATTLYNTGVVAGTVHGGDKLKNINPALPPQTPLRDTNANYIHSNLPEISITGKDKPNSNLQQQSGEEKRKADSGSILQQQQNSLGKTAAQDTPLFFSMNRESGSGSGFTTIAQTGDYSSSLRLPSGTDVPHSRIIDQVIHRFTMNRSLESGTVLLRMHPAELGELRMEIRVDQENIKASIITQNPQVQEVIDRYMSKLREALEEQGFNLEHIEVSVSDDPEKNDQHFKEQFNQHLSDERETNYIFSPVALTDDQARENDNILAEKSHRLSIHI